MKTTPFLRESVRAGRILGRRFAQCLLGTYCLLAATLGTGEAVDVSTPFGLVEVSIPAGGEVTAAMPFHPLSTNVESWLLGGLGAGTNALSALTWDPVALTYVPTAIIRAGDGFILRNQADVAQVRYLFGEVPLEESITVPLEYPLNRIGYPYAQSKELSGTLLWTLLQAPENAADDLLRGSTSSRTAETGAFELGVGYWYRRGTTTPLLWREPRPYSNPFPDADGGLDVVSASTTLAGIRITIAVRDPSIDRLDLYSHDAGGTRTFQPTVPWNLAQADLPVVAGSATATDAWDRSERADEPALVRYYVVGDASKDARVSGR